MDAVVALREAVMDLLQARGAVRAAEVLSRASVELVDTSEAWTMGHRTVVAQSLALLVTPIDRVLLQREPDLYEELREAFRTAMHSFETELGEMLVCLQLPRIERSWRQVYRSAPLMRAVEPDPEAVLEAAGALLDAMSAPEDAAVVRRSTLELAPMQSSGETLLLACVLHLRAEDLHRVRADRARHARIERAICDAATRPLVLVASLQLATTLPR